jgi:ATP-dependent RNA helicase DDX52/ROK1
VVVLDEADKLFELGREGAEGNTDKSFLGQIDEILAACSHKQVRPLSDLTPQRWTHHLLCPRSHGVPGYPFFHLLPPSFPPPPVMTQVQRALFSATLPEVVESLAGTVLRDPVKVVIGTRNAGATTIDQRLVFVGR